MEETKKPREYSRTEFISYAVLVAFWLLDYWFGTDLFDQVDLGQMTDAKAQVLALAKQIRGVESSNANLLLAVGALIYGGRKVEKIVERIWRFKKEL